MDGLEGAFLHHENLTAFDQTSIVMTTRSLSPDGSNLDARTKRPTHTIKGSNLVARTKIRTHTHTHTNSNYDANRRFKL
jgi:hypothetical protein